MKEFGNKGSFIYDKFEFVDNQIVLNPPVDQSLIQSNIKEFSCQKNWLFEESNSLNHPCRKIEYLKIQSNREDYRGNLSV